MSEMSRRDFLRTSTSTAAGIALGAAAGSVSSELSRRNEDQERRKFYESIKSITYEDLKRPESDKLTRFTRQCASEYARVTGLEINIDDLSQRTTMYGTEAEFFEGIRQSEPDYTYRGNTGLFGRTSFADNRVRINLGLIRDGGTRIETEYPGVMIFKQLCHEWGDVLAIDNRRGEQLGKDNNTFGDREGNDQQVWEKYRGCQIYSKDYRALILFDNAWNELTTRRIIMHSLKDDESLSSAVATSSIDTGYLEATNKLSRIVERLGLSLPEMASLHMNSDVEGVFQRIGTIFEDYVLETSPVEIIGGRNEQQIETDRDFLIGRRIAWVINNENWQKYGELLDHIKPRE